MPIIKSLNLGVFRTKAEHFSPASIWRLTNFDLQFPKKIPFFKIDYPI